MPPVVHGHGTFLLATGWCLSLVPWHVDVACGWGHYRACSKPWPLMGCWEKLADLVAAGLQFLVFFLIVG